jgi:hypothetical protein
MTGFVSKACALLSLGKGELTRLVPPVAVFTLAILALGWLFVASTNLDPQILAAI